MRIRLIFIEYLRTAGDLQFPVDDTAHKMRSKDGSLAAAEFAEMVMAAPRDRLTANLKDARIRRASVVSSACPARALREAPLRLRAKGELQRESPLIHNKNPPA